MTDRRSASDNVFAEAPERPLYCLHQIVEGCKGLSGAGGVQELLLKLNKDGCLLELVTENPGAPCT